MIVLLSSYHGHYGLFVRAKRPYHETLEFFFMSQVNPLTDTVFLQS
jgi:hypothetical protein